MGKKEELGGKKGEGLKRFIGSRNSRGRGGDGNGGKGETA